MAVAPTTPRPEGTIGLSAAPEIAGNALSPARLAIRSILATPTEAGEEENPLASIPAEIILEVVEKSDIRTLLKWRRVCKRIYRLVRWMLEERYRNLVAPHIPDVDAFSDLLNMYGAVISGSAALRFFLPDEPWGSRDLDVYVPDDSFDAFRAALEGGLARGSRILFDSADVRDPLDDDDYSVKQLIRYALPSGTSLDIIRSQSMAGTAPLLGFWSTLVVNYMTPTTFVCGYPGFTLDCVAVVKDNPFSGSDTKAVRKYTDRGFQVSDEVHWTLGEEPASDDGTYFEDRDENLDCPDSGVIAFSLDPLAGNEHLGRRVVTRGPCGWFIL